MPARSSAMVLMPSNWPFTHSSVKSPMERMGEWFVAEATYTNSCASMSSSVATGCGGMTICTLSCEESANALKSSWGAVSCIGYSLRLAGRIAPDGQQNGAPQRAEMGLSVLLLRFDVFLSERLYKA